MVPHMSRRLATAASLLLVSFSTACQGASAPPATATVPPPTAAPTVAPTVAAAHTPPRANAPTPTRSATRAPAPAPATPPRTTAAPTPSVAPAAPVPVGTSRAEVVNAADRAFQSGNTQAAIELYDRALNTPPAQGEAPSVTTAIGSYARFRTMLALVASGRDDEAHQQLAALRAHDANGPLTRLAGQFWDQYGMTAQAKASCAQLKPQLTTAAPALATLRGAGVTVEPDRLCTVPGG